MGRIEPVAKKRILKFSDGRTGQSAVEIVDFLFRARHPFEVFLADVQPADECGSAVDDQQFSVVSELNPPGSQKRCIRERNHFEIRRFFQVRQEKQGKKRLETAETVADYAHLDTLLCLFLQFPHHDSPDPVVRENESLHIDIVPCGTDALDHRGIGGGTVAEKFQPVSCKRNRPGDHGRGGRVFQRRMEQSVQHTAMVHRVSGGIAAADETFHDIAVVLETAVFRLIPAFEEFLDRM